MSAHQRYTSSEQQPLQWDKIPCPAACKPCTSDHHPSPPAEAFKPDFVQCSGRHSWTGSAGLVWVLSLRSDLAKHGGALPSGNSSCANWGPGMKAGLLQACWRTLDDIPFHALSTLASGRSDDCCHQAQVSEAPGVHTSLEYASLSAAPLPTSASSGHEACKPCRKFAGTCKRVCKAGSLASKSLTARASSQATLANG